MKSKFHSYEIDGFHLIAEYGRDTRGNFVLVYLNNLLSRPILTWSQKEGMFYPDVSINPLALFNAKQVVHWHSKNVVKFP